MSEFLEKVKTKRGEVVGIGSLVVAWGRTREVRAIKKIGDTYELRFDDNIYARLESVTVIPTPVPPPNRFIKFSTTTGPVYIDLEEVVAVMNSSGEHIRVMLRNTQTIDFNHTFKEDLQNIMDEWVEYQNDRWKRERRQ